MPAPGLDPQDMFEIHNLVARYCITTDDADVDAFMGCWVGPKDYGGYFSEAFGDMATWDEMRAFEAHHVGPGGMANGKRHQATNVLIEPVTRDEAHVSHDMLVLEVAEPPRLVATGRYNGSVVVRTATGWRFKSRTLHVDAGFFAAMAGVKVQQSPD